MRPRPDVGSTAYLTALALGALVSAALSLILWGPPEPLTWVIPLLVLSTLARAAPDIALRRITILLHSIVLVAAVPLVGPLGAMLVHALPTAWKYHNRPNRLVFNVASPVIAVFLGTLAVEGALQRSIRASDSPADLALELAVLTAVAAVVNAVTLAAVIRLTEGTPMMTILASLGPQIAPGYFGYGVAAYLLVILWAQSGLGWFSAVLLLPSLLVAQWSLLQQQRERRAYDTMLDALVETLEIRSPGSRQHSQVASRVASGIAANLGLSVDDVETISTAARLHDIGLLEAHPLAHPDTPRGDEVVSLLEHPEAGARLIGDVSFLRRATPAVLAHHERYDGGGYPQGLAGGSIPLGARVIAVADAWTSLTCPRSPRPALSAEEAVERCESLAGTALDPECVAALRQVLARHPSTLEVPEATSPVSDHRGWSPVDQAHPTMTAMVARLAKGEST